MGSLKELLSTPTMQVGRAQRFLVFQIKMWSHCIRLLGRNRAGQQAAALAYYTLFGLVPLAIVILLVFQYTHTYQDIGVKVKQFAYEQMHLTKIEYTPQPADPNQPNAPRQKVMLTDSLDKIIQQFFSGMDKGSVSLISAVLVIWAALGLLSTVERAFNRIWHVSRGRGFLHRMINYWALLTLGPLLLGVGIYAMTRYAALQNIETTVLTHVAPVIVSWALALLAFFLLYLLLPNTKVQAGPALWGAAVAALAWSVAKWGFGKYVTDFIPYGKVYGVLGLVPLTVFWIYITWLIILFGLQLTFTTQNLSTLDAAEIAAARKAEQDYFIANDLTAINLAKEIAESFERGDGPITTEAVRRKLDIPQELGDRLINCLIGAGLIARTQEPALGLILAKSPDRIKLSNITEAIAPVAFAQPGPEEHGALAELAQSQKQSLAARSLKDICTANEPMVAALPQGTPGETPIAQVLQQVLPPAYESEDAEQPDRFVADEVQAEGEQSDGTNEQHDPPAAGPEEGRPFEAGPGQDRQPDQIA
jgi:membrane protein